MFNSYANYRRWVSTMSSSSNEQGNETAPKKEWYQRLLFWRKNYDLQNTPKWRQIFDAIPTVLGIIWLIVGWVVMAILLGNIGGFFELTVWLFGILVLLVIAEKILDWLQGRGFGKIIEGEAAKVKSKVNPPQPRPAAKKAAAPGEPVTRPMPQRPTPVANPRQNRPTQNAVPRQNRAQPAASKAREDARQSQSAMPARSSRPAKVYAKGRGEIAREKLS